MINNSKPELTFSNREGVPMNVNPLSSIDTQKNAAVFAPFGAGMRMLEDYKENSGGMAIVTANAMLEMAKVNVVNHVVIDQGSSIKV